jgi:hypothetical protein
MEDATSEEEIKNYLVMLEPFAVLRPLDTGRPYFEHQSHGGLSAEWSDDSSVGLITLDSKWGKPNTRVTSHKVSGCREGGWAGVDFAEGA